MPWMPAGHSYPAPGPPQERTRLPAWSKTSTGGAAVQHSGHLRALARARSDRGDCCRVWVTQTWSWSSTHTPIAAPDHPVVRQRLGPERIDLEARRIDAAVLSIGVVLQDRLPDTERGNDGDECDERARVTCESWCLLASDLICRRLWSRDIAVATAAAFR